MKKFLQKRQDALADSALLEMGAAVSPVEHPKTVHESLAENLIEVAFAEAADCEPIHEAVLRERRRADDLAHPDDRRCGDNNACFVSASHAARTPALFSM